MERTRERRRRVLAERGAVGAHVRLGDLVREEERLLATRERSLRNARRVGRHDRADVTEAGEAGERRVAGRDRQRHGAREVGTARARAAGVLRLRARVRRGAAEGVRVGAEHVLGRAHAGDHRLRRTQRQWRDDRRASLQMRRVERAVVAARDEVAIVVADRLLVLHLRPPRGRRAERLRAAAEEGGRGVVVVEARRERVGRDAPAVRLGRRHDAGVIAGLMLGERALARQLGDSEAAHLAGEFLVARADAARVGLLLGAARSAQP